MNEKDAWNVFTNSGSVNDYLRYASLKKDEQGSLEEKNEVHYGRIGYQGTEYKGTRQDHNNTDEN